CRPIRSHRGPDRKRARPADSGRHLDQVWRRVIPRQPPRTPPAGRTESESTRRRHAIAQTDRARRQTGAWLLPNLVEIHDLALSLRNRCEALGSGDAKGISQLVASLQQLDDPQACRMVAQAVQSGCHLVRLMTSAILTSRSGDDVKKPQAS